MADMFAIVDKDGEIDCVCLTEDKALMILHSIHDCGIRGDQTITFEDRGYRCIPVTVTPKGEVDCRLCEYFIPKDSDCGARSFGHYTACTNGDVFKPSAPIQLYNVTGE